MDYLINKAQGITQEVTIGTDNPVKIGGEEALPFLDFEGKMPNPPVVAHDVWDMEPENWPKELKDHFGEAIKDPVAWAKKAVNDFGAKIICLRLASTHPDSKNTSPKDAGETVKKVLAEVNVPLLIIGSGNAEKDALVMVEVAEAAKGKQCFLGIADADNYKTITAACQSGGHGIIAESPIDINMAKQLNILITDTGFPVERIIMHHATGSLGYGMEYTYSIMERSRLACLQGDKMMSPPMVSFIAQEAWKAKEAKTPNEEAPEWGDIAKRGPLWEATTAIGLLHAGASLLVMAHPEAIKAVEKAIADLT